MEPVVGHCRRKSSLINPATGAHRGRFSISANGDAPPPHDSPRDASTDDDVDGADEEMGLSAADRRRRRTRLRRNTQLHNRIAPEKDISPDERQEADKHVVRRLLVNVLFILLWYMFSLSISLVSAEPLPPPSPTPLPRPAPSHRHDSTISGCLIRTASTSPSRSSPPRPTCSSNSP